MTEKHLIVLDLDGTLLTNEKHLQSDKKNVSQIKRYGHEVMIATGSTVPVNPIITSLIYRPLS